MLSYRRALAADLPFIIGLTVADNVGPSMDSLEDAMTAPYLDALAAIDASPYDELYIVERDGAAVGTFQLTFLPGLMRRGMWRGQIEGVHVIPAARSLGIGSEMMRWAIARCRARGCGLVQLTSNKARVDAHRFYERLGFAKSHEGFKLIL